MTKLNPGSIDYLANMSLKKITRKENKMEIITNVSQANSSIAGKKRQYGEERKTEAVAQTKDTEVDSIQQRMRGLELTAKQQTQVLVRHEETLLSSNVETEERKIGKKYRTNSEEQKGKQAEFNRMEIYQEPQVKAEASTSRQKSQNKDLIIAEIPLSQSM